MSKKMRFHTNVRLTHQWGRNGLTVTYHGPQPRTNRKVGEKRMHPKLKKLDLLKTNSPAEKDLVKHVVASMLEKLGEKKTVKVLADLNQANVKLVDFVNALSSTNRNVPEAPSMRWRLNEEGRSEPDLSHLSSDRKATITETGRVNLGGGGEMFLAPKIDWSKVKK